MPNQRVIDPLELRRMVEAGHTYKDIAKHFNVTVSGVQQAAERAGLTRKALSHKEFIPWVVAPEHRHSGPATNLRNLSMVAQGRDIPLAKLNTSLRWATRLLDNNLDIGYDRTRGFTEKPADMHNWHIRKVLIKLHEALARNPQ